MSTEPTADPSEQMACRWAARPVPDRARTQEALARWLIAQGRADDAAPLLAEARATYEKLGAARWLQRLDQMADGSRA